MKQYIEYTKQELKQMIKQQNINTNSIVCFECGKSFNYNKSWFNRHIKKEHNLTTQQYYDKWLKEPNEGTSIISGNQTTFYNILQGYATILNTESINKIDVDIENICIDFLNGICIKNICNTHNIKQSIIKKILNQNIQKYYLQLQYCKEPNYICNICFQPYTTIYTLSKHINQHHNITQEEYYLKYMNGIKQHCLTCGKQVQFYNLNKKYAKYCSAKCCSNSKETQQIRKQTCIEKYGVSSPMELSEVQEKLKQSMLTNWGVKHPMESKEIRLKQQETTMKNFGVYNPSQSKEIQNKKAETMIKNWGCENYFKSDNFKNLWKNETFVSLFNQKHYETKKKNNTFNTSKIEQELKILLVHIFSDLQIQYKSEEFPFSIDYYIPEINLYIDLNASWTHGGMIYDENDNECIKQLSEWKEKSKTSKFYKNAIYTWTVLDVKKRTYNVNRLEVFSNDIEKAYYQIIYYIIQHFGRVVTNKQLQQEYNYIINNQGSLQRTTNTNNITTYFQPHFYEKEISLLKDESTFIKIVQNRQHYLNKKFITPNEIIRGVKISGLHYGYSHHSPFWIKWFIQEYNISSIYDPCGGWGHRLLGSHHITYIYNDIDTNTFEGCKNISTNFNMMNKTFYNNDASLFTPKETYDAVFTCPPYFNTEQYNTDNTSHKQYSIYNEWLNCWWRKVINCSMKQTTKYFAFIINSKYKEDMKKICDQEYLIFVNEFPLHNKKSHLNKNSNNQEFLVVFKNINFVSHK
jgi:predicted transcriptional regulator